MNRDLNQETENDFGVLVSHLSIRVGTWTFLCHLILFMKWETAMISCCHSWLNSCSSPKARCKEQVAMDISICVMKVLNLVFSCYDSFMQTTWCCEVCYEISCYELCALLFCVLPLCNGGSHIFSSQLDVMLWRRLISFFYVYVFCSYVFSCYVLHRFHIFCSQLDVMNVRRGVLWRLFI